MKLQYFVFFLTFLYSFELSKCIASYSIDLSSEFIKVAVVKPGIPMEIALNTDSQRKTPAVVFIRNGERLFENAAMNMGIKFPKYMYHSLSKLLGKELKDSYVQQFLKDYPHFEMLMTDDGLLAFKHDDKTIYTVEELLGMLLQHAKDIADNFAEIKVKSGIIIVPPYYTQKQRNALSRVAKIADIEILQLMNSNAAVALNYGIFRRKSFNATVQYYMFFDVGSSATIATLVGYQMVQMKEAGMRVENPQVTIYGIGYSEDLGTLRFVLRLQQHLADSFNKMKKTKDVRTVPRAMAKLLKEAGRVMKVLSANSETYAQIENVMDEVDLKVKVTRTEFESLCKDLMARIREPLIAALEGAQLPLPTIKEIILMGGGTRIPKIQDILMEESEKKELGKGVNTDEAAALGAVYQAARISPGFRVKPFIVKDLNLVTVSVDFVRYKTNKDDPKQEAIPQPTSRVLFNVGNPFPQKKVLTFNKHMNDFEFNASLGSEKKKKVLFSVNLNNLTATTKKMLKKSELYTTEFKGVKAHFGMDESGLFSLRYVEALFERKSSDAEVEKSTFEKIGSTISNMFGSGNEDKKSKEGDAKSKNEKTGDNKTDKKETDKSKDTNSSATKTSDSTKKSNQTIPVVEMISQRIKFTVEWPANFHVSQNTLDESIEKLANLRKADEDRIALEKAQNELESYIFNVRSSVEDESLPHYPMSSPTERENILVKVKELSEWYDEHAGSPETTVDQYRKHLSDLQKMMSSIDMRVSEAKLRPKVISALTTAISTGELFLKNLANLTGSIKSNTNESNQTEVPSVITDTEFKTFKNLLRDTTEWFKKSNESLAAIKSYENPPVSATEFETQARGLEREMGYLFNKLTIWRRDAEAQAEAARRKAEEEKEAAAKANATTTDSTEKVKNKDSNAKEGFTKPSDKDKTKTSTDKQTTTPPPENSSPKAESKHQDL